MSWSLGNVQTDYLNTVTTHESHWMATYADFVLAPI